MDDTDLALNLCIVAHRAGSEILAVKRNLANDGVEIKGDGSPVTTADLNAHDAICKGLTSIDPRIPVVSEEGSIGDPSDSDYCFLVDPLDGTKEFIRGSDMYTVNIALMRSRGLRWHPVLGVVHAPETGTTWFGGENVGPFRQSRGLITSIGVSRAERPPIVVGSVSHRSPMDNVFLESIGEHTSHGIGSSIKICKVADGSADLAPRFGTTSCWDTAAAHAVLKSAGGTIVDPNGVELDYDLVGNVLNPWFMAANDHKWIHLWMRHQN
jgi:3'(2'), 5'-bisphosphate nucleotidase